MTQISADQDSSRRVAVYFDFENLLISQYNRIHGKDTWYQDRHTPKDKEKKAAEAAIDLDALLSFAAALGAVVVNRTYCDWTRPVLTGYGEEFARRSVEPIQMFSKDSGKNGADIRIALDVEEDLRWDNLITDVVLFSGDGDFLPVADLCRRRGVNVHAVGVRGSSGGLWQKWCRFHFYEEVTARQTSLASVREIATAAVDPVRLLQDALLRIPRQWIDRNHLEAVMRRRNWAFSLQATGTGDIDQLIRSAVSQQLVEQSGDRIRLLPAPSTGQAISPADDHRALAVYWHLEDLAVAVYDGVHGPGTWRNDRVDAVRSMKFDRNNRIGLARIHIPAVMNFARNIAPVVLNRLYADWTKAVFRDYRSSVTGRPPAEFVQIHPGLGLPVGVRLPADVMRDLRHTPRITDVLVCSGTQGFEGIAEHCERTGIRLHAVGGTADHNAQWRETCVFSDYTDLMPPRGTSAEPWVGYLLAPFNGDPSTRIKAAPLKSRIKQLDSAFDEKTYGFRGGFRSMLRNAQERGLLILEDDDRSDDIWVRLNPQRPLGNTGS